MPAPTMSAHFAGRKPSVIRLAQIEFAQRNDATEAINVAIGNVSLPMHPAMIERLRDVTGPDSPFKDGVVQYTITAGLPETRDAFLNILSSGGYSTDGLHVQITDGGSAMRYAPEWSPDAIAATFRDEVAHAEQRACA